MTTKLEPRLISIKGGWAAIGKDWAVFGTSKEEAVLEYEAAEKRHAEIESREIPNLGECSPAK